jgi:hypothetical protein
MTSPSFSGAIQAMMLSKKQAKSAHSTIRQRSRSFSILVLPANPEFLGDQKTIVDDA